MASITAIELGADTCALARTSVRRGEIRVSAFETLDPAAFPGGESFAVALRQTRRALKLPRRCRVVLWGLREGADRKDAAVKPLLAPLVAAGFRVERVVSPCNALAALARVRATRGEGATCWLVINRGGVAILIVRPGKQIYAHSFVWDSMIGATGSQARLLQRYSLVSFLSPEVKRALAEARSQGTPVDAVVTCGNLPDLRSLTMPLIEDLDVEVETLDSLDGLIVKPAAAERLAEAAPAIRLACAGTLARGTRAWDESKRRAVHRAGTLFRVAAGLAAVAVVAVFWYEWQRTSPRAASPAPVTKTAQAVPSRSEARAARSGERGARGGGPVTAPAPVPAAAAPPPVVAPKTQAPEPPRTAARASDLAPRDAKPPVAAPKTEAPQQPGNAPRTSNLPPRDANPPRVAIQPLTTAPAPTVPRPQAPGTGMPVASPPPRIPAAPAVTIPATPPPPATSKASAPSGVIPAPRPADKPDAGAAAPRGPMPPLLKDPLPRVTAILVSNDRRFATVNDGQIIGVGDVLGQRIVVGIEERAVVLREPSGVQIRVGLGGRLLGVERGR